MTPLPADTLLAASLERVLALADDPDACIKGTPMIPIHRNTLRQIRASLRTARADAERSTAKVDSLRHHVRALQMLCRGQHAPIDLNAFCAEVDAIDAAIATRVAT
jgi:hypothetical protein